MNEISEKKSEILKSLNEQFVSNFLEIERKRLILRNHILKSIDNFSNSKKLSVVKKLADFGKEADTEIQIEKFFADTLPRLFKEMETFLYGGDKRMTCCLWQLGDEVFQDLRQSLIDDGNEDIISYLKEFLFTFDDIVRLNDRDIQKVLREVDTADLAKALLVSTEEAKEKIFTNMSVRAGTMLKEDIKYLKNVPRKDSFEARRKITNLILRFVDRGEIVIQHFEGDFLDEIY